MDIKAYIESGIIESYVLGLANAEEVAELEALRLQHAEISEAINSFSDSLEAEALSAAIEPPAFIEENILKEIAESQSGKAVVVPFNTATSDGISSSSSNMGNKPTRWRLLAAASIILFVVSASLNYYLFQKYSANSQAYLALLSERDTLVASNRVYQASQREWESTAKMMADPAMLMVKMSAPAGKNTKNSTIFWDTRSKDVYLVGKELPAPVSGKQFQLWAIVDGKPVDAGMIDPTCNGVCKMKNIPRAQSFAITLEKEGGSPQPTLSELLVIGNI